MTPTVGRTGRRPGSGHRALSVPTERLPDTSTVSTGSGKPFNSNAPTRGTVTAAPPAINRTTSAARICPARTAHRASRLDHRVAEVVVVLSA